MGIYLIGDRVLATVKIWNDRHKVQPGDVGRVVESLEDGRYRVEFPYCGLVDCYPEEIKKSPL